MDDQDDNSSNSTIDNGKDDGFWFRNMLGKLESQALSYVENQLLSIGSNVTSFCSELMHEVLPSSLLSNVFDKPEEHGTDSAPGSDRTVDGLDLHCRSNEKESSDLADSSKVETCDASNSSGKGLKLEETSGDILGLKRPGGSAALGEYPDINTSGGNHSEQSLERIEVQTGSVDSNESCAQNYPDIETAGLDVSEIDAGNPSKESLEYGLPEPPSSSLIEMSENGQPEVGSGSPAAIRVESDNLSEESLVPGLPGLSLSFLIKKLKKDLQEFESAFLVTSRGESGNKSNKTSNRFDASGDVIMFESSTDSSSSATCYENAVADRLTSLDASAKEYTLESARPSADMKLKESFIEFNGSEVCPVPDRRTRTSYNKKILRAFSSKAFGMKNDGGQERNPVGSGSNELMECSSNVHNLSQQPAPEDSEFPESEWEII